MALNNYITIPSATEGATASRTTTAWGYSDYATLSTGESSKIAVYGVLIHHDVVSTGASLDVTYESLLELYYGDSDTLFAQIPFSWRIDTRVNWTFTKLLQLPEGVEVPQGQRIRCRVADSIDSATARNYAAIKLMYRDLGVNTPPTVALNTIDATTFTTATPTLEFTGTDAGSDDVCYEIEIRSVT